MKKILYILILGLFAYACKSTQSTKNNQLDVTTVKTENINNQIKVKQIDLDEFEITFHTANPKEKVSFTDSKGNTKTFKNVKKVNLKKKQETKKDSAVSNQSQKEEKKEDKSKIKETNKSTSDTKEFKGMFLNLAIIFGFLLIGYLVHKFKK